jgi:carbamate kinase
MRIVIAMGGNALLRRSDHMTTEVQRCNIPVAARAIAPLAADNSVVVVHGNGPQVGLLGLQASAYKGAEPYPLDVLDAGTQGMIGYLIQQELRCLLPPQCQVATLLTMIVVDPRDPAFSHPTKFVGPGYPKDAADALAAEKGWMFRQDGDAWRRVVPSPEPLRIMEIQPITWLLGRGAVVICAGGGGIPTMYQSAGTGDLVGVEAVIDKDLASELLAEEVHADLFLMATDVDGVDLDWGTPGQLRLDQVTPGRTDQPSVRGRLHGSQGRGGSPVHVEDRPAGGHWVARGHCRDRGWDSGHQRGRVKVLAVLIVVVMTVRLAAATGQPSSRMSGTEA